jgi:hypothetical protein
MYVIACIYLLAHRCIIACVYIYGQSSNVELYMSHIAMSKFQSCKLMVAVRGANKQCMFYASMFLYVFVFVSLFYVPGQQWSP